MACSLSCDLTANTLKNMEIQLLPLCISLNTSGIGNEERRLLKSLRYY
jgi:hypothetical protein